MERMNSFNYSDTAHKKELSEWEVKGGGGITSDVGYTFKKGKIDKNFL